LTAREIKGKIIDFELYRMEKELEKFKDYDKKNLFADYYASDECKNPDSYGIVRVKYGECGRTFTKDEILKEN
jgi:hypothetical protein